MLAAPEAADAPEIFERYAADPEVTRYVGWPRHLALADSEAFVAWSSATWARVGFGPYLIRDLSGLLLGGSGLNPEERNQVMTGYVLARDAWGRGFASEALRAMVDLARSLDRARIFALCHPEHRPSRLVLEKAGFSIDAAWSTPIEFPNLEPGRFQDVVCYEGPLCEGGAHE